MNTPETIANVIAGCSPVNPWAPFAALLPLEISDALGVGPSELNVISVLPESGVVGAAI